MSFITKKALKFMLRDKNTFNDIIIFCKNKQKLCQENKDILCKKVLQVSNYTVPKNTSSCTIFNELLDLARSTEKNISSSQNILLMHPALLNKIEIYGSKHLKIFMIQNGYDLQMNRKRSFLRLLPNSIQSSNINSIYIKDTVKDLII